jgi:hypothetical protein
MSKRPTAGASASARKKPKTAARKKPAAAPEPIEIPAPKRGRGRPTTYDPAFCDLVIELGEQGKGPAQISRALGCSRKSFYLWQKVHPEFKEAVEEARWCALAWYEDLGQAGLGLPKFNAALYAFQMKNKFREFYADKVDLAHSGSIDPGEPEERQLTDLELARRIAFIFNEGMKPDAATSHTLSLGP